jgi:predicted acetylornithine/succinylornithine family transaminase
MDTYSRWPVVPVEGRGMYLTDTDGRHYLDFLAGIAVNVLGHAHPATASAVALQAERLQHCSNLFHIPAQIELAEKLLGLSDFHRAFFCNSGTEAIEAALKLARLWGKERKKGAAGIVAMERSFHGRTVGALSLTGQEKYRAPFAPLMPEVTFVPFNDTSALDAAVDDGTCAVILEPVQGEGGIYPARKEYLEAARRFCTERDALLLFDEVQCGMGRTGSLFAYQHYGVVPDAVSMAKGLGGGLPIGALLAGEKADLFSPGHHAATFGGNPISCAAANAVLHELTEGGVLERSRDRSAYLWQRLSELRAQNSTVSELRGIGLMIGMELTVKAGPVVDTCRERGLLVGKAGDRVIRLVPPLILEREHIDTAVDIIEDSLHSHQAPA